MAGEKTPQPADRSDDTPSGAGQGWVALSYLIAGMGVWGFIGWLADQWLHTGGVVTGIGIVFGMVGGVILVIRKLGTPT
jgi:F0F1-type ATP synthase assembly protein I